MIAGPSRGGVVRLNVWCSGIRGADDDEETVELSRFAAAPFLILFR